ncbi:glutamate-1-semialdehyde 2,1-aminomutase [Anaerobacterium chartisolvens]|uniref:Glutamate-1-semialdehyde 2,1-aminomutase n=1 Tax=Anaerobacterium chartisolvens TaxID=1297424 RepID=A0A369BAM5_9FIRM|nr:glutamate-1-semialdehyde 2,1-aminomutase [Anaerobacterium chartisolvens]RCX17567.1 glutamate-1-semialdehyde 2,1-aminomutase [Anaerobacterium chartisolvens]
MDNARSQELFEMAKMIIPGGVNSPVRAFGPVGLKPPFILKAKGEKIFDADGNRYIDYVGSWGPMILGHARAEVVEAVKKAAEDGSSYGAPTEKEVVLAQMICDAVPSVEMVRMVNSGTEAVMSAVRLARAYTGRDAIVKFEGCYHGHWDGLLVKAGSGALTMGVPNSPGVPSDYVKSTVTACYNDCLEIQEIFADIGSRIAAVIVEPVAGNMGLVPPDIEFLKLLRRLTAEHGAVLIFDEVITGFRVSYGGAQEYYGVLPDITTLGKIIGGGMPVGAYGGRRDIMKLVSPSGPVYQAGTLSGNPVAMAAGIKTLEILRDNPSIYSETDKKAERLEKAFNSSAERYEIPLHVNRVGSALSPFFTRQPVSDFKTAVKSDTRQFAGYFGEMLRNGIYLPPSQFETMFVSHAHTEAGIKTTEQAIGAAFLRLKETTN